MNELRAIYTIWQRELIRYWRDKARILTSLAQPIMFLVIFGTGFKQTLATGGFGVDFIKFMYPGIFAMTIMGTAFFSTVSTVWDREFGFLKEILVAPVSRVSIALAKTLGATTIAVLQSLILLVLAPIMGLPLTFILVLKLMVFMILLAVAISGLGLLIASLMKSTESFGIIMQIFILPLFFLSGAFFPLTAVPRWMEILSKLNPLTYGVDAFRQIILNGSVPQAVIDKLVLFPPHADALFLLGFAILMILLAILAFNRGSDTKISNN